METVKIKVDNLSKVYGRSAKKALKWLKEGKDKQTILKETGASVGVNRANFTVQNGVSCGQHWTDYITFRYDRARGGFFFNKRVTESWEMNTDDRPDADAMRMSEHTEIKADPRKPVSLSAYTPTP